jgi:hypothetical protein
MGKMREHEPELKFKLHKRLNRKAALASLRESHAEIDEISRFCKEHHKHHRYGAIYGPNKK